MSNPVTFVTSAARTVDGQSAAQQAHHGSLDIAVDITAVSGTSPTIDFEIEWSHDGGTTWASADPADTFSQITAAGTVVKTVPVRAHTWRLTWTLGGSSPSFTFSADVHNR